MYDTDTKSQFLELRPKDWSLKRIAEHLQVAQRTLVVEVKPGHPSSGSNHIHKVSP